MHMTFILGVDLNLKIKVHVLFRTGILEMATLVLTYLIFLLLYLE